ncbi:MAG: pilus assembly protein PilM, partial [Planctomycetota bacterium]
EVDTIQLSPLAVYNFATFDRLDNLEGSEGFDAEDQPPSIVVLSFGAETTDLVVTNGYRVWQRNIPIGGSHFTKALAKEMRLTFAKAEHLKRNATQADDPKAVFQAMRPVFSDLVTEIQRSIGFYLSNHRGAELKEIIALGNPMKLPGLQRYLAQNLEQPVTPIEDYAALVGGSVTAAPQFKDNHLSFAVAYGLCVQGLGDAKLSTSLLPEEIFTKRLIRGKKPWAVAAAAMLLVGLTVNYFSYVASWRTVNIEKDWSSSIAQSKQVSSLSSRLNGADSELRDRFESIKTVGDNLQSNADGRLLWLELLNAVDVAVPKDDRPEAEREKTIKDVSERRELHIESMDCQFFPDLSRWFNGPVQAMYEEALKSDELAETAAAEAAEAAAAEAGPDQTAEAEQGAAEEAVDADGNPIDSGVAEQDPIDEGIAEDNFGEEAFADNGFEDGGLEEEAGPIGPEGEGWVIQLVGYHFHNSLIDGNEKLNDVDRDDEGARFVRKTLIKNLLEQTVLLPDGENGEVIEVPLTELKISHPVLVTALPILGEKYDPDAQPEDGVGGGPAAAGRGLGMGMGMGAGGGVMGEEGADGLPGEEAPEPWKLRRYDFVVQFVWKPTPKNIRQGGGSDEEALDEFSSLDATTPRVATRP